MLCAIIIDVFGLGNRQQLVHRLKELNYVYYLRNRLCAIGIGRRIMLLLFEQVEVYYPHIRLGYCLVI